MKKRVISILLVMLISVSGIMSASCIAAGEIFISTDEKYSVTANKRWTYMTGELSTDAIIEIGSDKDDRYLLAGTYYSDDFSSFDNFSKSMLYFLQALLENASSQGTESLKINKKQAYRTAIMAEMNGTEVFIIHYTINCGDEFVQLLIWTDASSYTEKSYSQLTAIAESFNKNNQ